MSRLWRPLAFTALLAVACAGEEFKTSSSSSSNQVTGASGNGESGGQGSGGAQTVGRGGGASEPEAGAAGEVESSGGSSNTGGSASTGSSSSSGTGGTADTSRGGAAQGGSIAGVSASGAGGAGDDTCLPGTTGPACTEYAHACRELPGDSPSGTYRIDPDGSGPIAPFDASCDMSEGGGWTLILNYVHKGGTNPALAPRKDSLPLLGSDVLGTDESAVVKSWGHAATSLVSALKPQALRFQGRISLHTRVIDFVTSDKDCLAYAMGGSTNCKTLVTGATLLSGHTATLPLIATAFMTGKGDLALTEFPFYLGGQAHWAVKGETQRWEVDNTPVAGVAKYSYDTVHRVWMR